MIVDKRAYDRVGYGPAFHAASTASNSSVPGALGLRVKLILFTLSTGIFLLTSPSVDLFHRARFRLFPFRAAEAPAIPPINAARATAGKTEAPASKESQTTEGKAEAPATADEMKLMVRYLLVTPGIWKTSHFRFTEIELGDYYSSHQEKFSWPRRAKVEFVEFAKKPSPADIERIGGKMEKLYGRLKAGEDFHSLAVLESEHPSAKNGGDRGYVAAPATTGELWTQALELETGQISRPFRDSLGWHIIGVEGRRGEQLLRIRQITKRPLASEETLKTVREMAFAFAEGLSDSTFYESALKAGLEVRESEYFMNPGERFRDPGAILRHAYILGLGHLPEGVRFSFEAPPGSVSPIFENRTGYYYLKVRDRTEPQSREFESVRNAVKTNLIRDRREEMIQRTCAEIDSLLQAGETLERIGRLTGIEVIITEYVAEGGIVPGIESHPELVAAMREYEPVESPVKRRFTKGMKNGYIYYEAIE